MDVGRRAPIFGGPPGSSRVPQGPQGSPRHPGVLRSSAFRGFTGSGGVVVSPHHAPIDLIVTPSPHRGAESPRGSDFRTDLGLLILTLVWGVNFAVVKGALVDIPAMAFNALRFPLASLTVYLILRARGPLPSFERRDLGRILFLGVAGNGVYQLLFIHGLDRTSAGNTALLLATVPVWAALLSALLREGTLDRYVVGGIMATLAGMVLVILGGDAQLQVGASTLAGDLMAAGAAFLWATYTVGSRGLILRYGSVPVTAWTLWVGTVVLVILGIPDLVTMDWGGIPALSGWGAVGFAGVFALGLSYLLWYRGVHRLGSARTAAYSNLVPVVALLTAWALLGEVPSALQWGGAVVILGGIVLARFGGRTTPIPEPAPTPSVPPARVESPGSRSRGSPRH
jgi:drug/metabolite transporter (DMT)-like permease